MRFPWIFRPGSTWLFCAQGKSSAETIAFEILCQAYLSRRLYGKQTWVTLSQSCGRTPGQQNEEKKGVHPCPERTLRQSNESASIMAGLGGPTVGHSAPRLPTDNTPGRFFILSAFRLLGVGLALTPQRPIKIDMGPRLWDPSSWWSTVPKGGWR